LERVWQAVESSQSASLDGGPGWSPVLCLRLHYKHMNKRQKFLLASVLALQNSSFVYPSGQKCFSWIILVSKSLQCCSRDLHKIIWLGRIQHGNWDRCRLHEPCESVTLLRHWRHTWLSVCLSCSLSGCPPYLPIDFFGSAFFFFFFFVHLSWFC
jgi:hypothetical protein